MLYLWALKVRLWNLFTGHYSHVETAWVSDSVSQEYLPASGQPRVSASHRILHLSNGVHVQVCNGAALIS